MIREVELGYAADVHRGRRAAAAVFGDHQPGSLILEVFGAGQAKRSQLIAAECRNGDTHILQALLALLRRDDDLLEIRLAERETRYPGQHRSRDQAEALCAAVI